MGKFSIRNVQTLTGEENIAFECDLYTNKKKIAKVRNTGTSGDHTYDWRDPLVKEEFEKEVTDELIWELISEKVPPREIPDSVFEHRKQDEDELSHWCSEISKSLTTLIGGTWVIGPGTGGTTKISHSEGWNFGLFIASGMDYKDHTHELHIAMGRPSGIKKVNLTEKEKKKWRIPEFDLRICTASEIAEILQSKIKWVKSILPQLQERQAEETNELERIQAAGRELAEALQMPLEERGGYKNSFSIKREEEKLGGESFSVSVDAYCCDNQSSFFLSANHIPTEKLLKLIEFCKQLEI